MKLTYIGPKQKHTFNFPIPYLSKGENEGQIVFEKNKQTEVKEEWATRLLEFCPHFFEKPQAQKG